MINSFEFQESNVSFSLNTNNKPKSRKLEKTILLIQIFSDKLGQIELLFAWKEHTTFYIDHECKVINFILNKTAFTSRACWDRYDIPMQLRMITLIIAA